MEKKPKANSGKGYAAPQQESHALVNLFKQGRYVEMEARARVLTKRFPGYAPGWNMLGVALNMLGHSETALKALQKAVKLTPRDADLHNNLGLTYTNLGRWQEAESAYLRALHVRSDYSEAHNNLGNLLVTLGRLDEAAASYRRAIAIQPEYVEALGNLGIVLKNLGQLREAENCYQRALEISPHSAALYNNLGNLLRITKRHHEAEACYRTALKINPSYAEAHNNLGVILRDMGRLKETEACYRRALEINPDYAEAYSNLGLSHKDLGQPVEAEACFRQALALQPLNAAAHSNFGELLWQQDRLEDAASHCLRSLEIKPGTPETLNNLGNVYKDAGRLTEAVACYQKALAVKPDYAGAYSNLGNALQNLGRLEEAGVYYRKALEQKPDFIEAFSNLLLTMNYAAWQHLPSHYDEARAYGRLVASRATQPYTTWNCHPHPQRLRVGMVSGDLRRHPVGYFLESVLGQLDQARVELIAYPTVHATDELTERIRPFFTAWKPLKGLNDEDAARLIHEDGVHLLLDLAGHTAHNRLPVFTWKPAPVQVTWMGYFATTGLKEMDYLLADPFVAPPEEEGHFAETVWRLPECYLCFTPPDLSLEPQPLPALANSFITFGCFNNLTKMNDTVVALWARVLQSVPNSCLLLKTRQLNDPGVCEVTRQRFVAQGIVPERLILEGESPRKELLAAYNRVDIALDPFPYPGGTTSVEALWMGVPVLTLRGNRFLSHIGESIVHNAGLTDWIAADEGEYVARAAMHVADLHKLALLRSGLRQQVLASPLFDAKRFATNLENALWNMWEQRQHCAIKGLEV